MVVVGGTGYRRGYSESDDGLHFDFISLLEGLTARPYETNLVEVGNILRKGLDQRSLSGAERYVINLEKKRFGESKLKEAEEEMRKAEQRVEAARQIGFAKLLIQSLLVTWFVIIFSILIIGLSILSIGEPTLNELLVIELVSSFGIMAIVYTIKENISNDDFVRRELLWFPMFIVGNVTGRRSAYDDG